MHPTPPSPTKRKALWLHLLQLAGRTQLDIAKELKVHPTYVGKVLSGERTNARIRQALADAIDLSVEQAWGALSDERLELELRHRLQSKALEQAQTTFAEVVRCGSARSRAA